VIASQTHNIFWFFKPDRRQRKLLFCLNIPSRAFPLEIISSLDELSKCISVQNHQMGAIFRTLTNFKRLRQVKMTRAITRQRLAILKETFARYQKQDYKITLAADEKEGNPCVFHSKLLPDVWGLFPWSCRLYVLDRHEVPIPLHMT